MAGKKTSDILFVPYGAVPSPIVTTATPSTTWYEGRKDGEEASFISLPRTVYEANMMYVKNVNHPAMNMMGSSLKAHRSCNEAIIYLYGVSGAGKSSTINHLFNRENMVPVSSSQSCTSEVAEYVSTVQSDHWKVSNLQIGFIDTPGWDDTRSKDMDAFNFALMENFIATHPYLSCKTLKIYPNIVLIVIRAVDNRIIGENAKTSQMLRAISQLEIVDTDRPNVVFILTHAWAIPERRYAEESRAQKERVRQLSREFLGVTAPVVMIENKYHDNNLERCGDFTLLRDGNKQPLNLYNAMKKLMKGCNDEVGIEAVRIFFGSRHLNGKIEKRHVIDENRLDRKLVEKCKVKWTEELNKDIKLNSTTEVALILEKFKRERRDDISQHFPKVSLDENGFFGPLFRVLETHNITTLKELQKSYKQIIKQKKCPLNDVEKYILLGILEIDTTVYSDETLGVIGKGYECYCEMLAPKEIFKPVESDKLVFNSTLVKKIPMRYAITPCKKLSVSYGRTSLIRSDYYSIANVRKYKESDDGVTCGFMEGFYFGVEEYLFAIALDIRNVSLNAEFCREVEKLPHEWENSHGRANTEFQEFFKNYGYWIILQGKAGGFLQGNYKPPNRNMPIKDIQVGIEGYIERLKNVSENWDKNEINNPYGMMAGIEHSYIQWLGGDKEKLPNLFGEIKASHYLPWLESLTEQPVIFEHSLTNVPIYEFVRSVNNEKGELVKSAFTAMHPESANTSYHTLDSFSQLLGNASVKLKPLLPSKPKRVEDSFVIIDSNVVHTTPVGLEESPTEQPIEIRLIEKRITPRIPIKPPQVTNPLASNTPNRPSMVQMEPLTATPPHFSSLRPPVKPKPKPKMMASLSSEGLTASQRTERHKSYANLLIGEDEGETVPEKKSPSHETQPEPIPRRAVTRKNVANKLEEQLKRSSTYSGPVRPPMKPPTGVEEWRPVPSPRGATKHGNEQSVTENKITAVRTPSNEEIINETTDNDVIDDDTIKEVDEDTREGQSIKSKRKINQEDGCFPGCAKVFLKGGVETCLEDLKIGDYVLSIDRKSLKRVYSKVYMWAHLNSTAIGEYIHIDYGYGTLRLTPRHLLLTIQSDDTSAQVVAAERVKAGDLLFHVEPDKKRPFVVRVMEVFRFREAYGFYSPVTYNSMIIVDGIACSVWSLPATGGLLGSCHQLGHLLFSAHRVTDWLGMKTLLNEKLDEDSGKDRYCILLEKVYSKIGIMKMF